jgi:hypothetical protein
MVKGLQECFQQWYSHQQKREGKKKNFKDGEQQNLP